MFWGSAAAKPVIDAATLPLWPMYYKAMRAGQAPSTLKPTEYAVDEKINNKIVLWRGDITQLKIGAIVNAANSDLWPGGGVCGAIHRAAGARLSQECDKKAPCDTGQTVITGGYKLPATHVLHSVGPTNRSNDLLTSCYRTLLDVSKQNKVRSICTCCISTGIFGFPNRRACEIALSTVRKWLEVPENFAAIDLFVFCTFMIEDVNLYDELTPVYFPVELREPAEAPPAQPGEETKMAVDTEVASGPVPATASLAPNPVEADGPTGGVKRSLEVIEGPSQENGVSASNGHAPASNGHAPASNGHVPASNGHAPDSSACSSAVSSPASFGPSSASSLSSSTSSCS